MKVHLIFILFYLLVNNITFSQENKITFLANKKKLNKASKFVISPDSTFLVISQIKKSNDSAELIIVENSANLKTKSSVNSPEILDIHISKNHSIYTLVNNGDIFVYSLNENKTKLSLKHKISSSKFGAIFTKGLLKLNKTHVFTYLENKNLSYLNVYENMGENSKKTETLTSSQHEILENTVDMIIKENYLYAYSWKHANIGVFKIQPLGKLSLLNHSFYQGFYNSIKKLPISQKKLYMSTISSKQYDLRSPISVASPGNISKLGKLGLGINSIPLTYQFEQEKFTLSINNNNIYISKLKAYNRNETAQYKLGELFNQRIEDVIINNKKLYLLTANNLCVYNFFKPPNKASQPSLKNQLKTNIINIKLKEDVNKTDSYGASKLMWAFYFDDLESAKILINNGAKIKINGAIYRDRNFEKFYGNLTSIAIEQNLELLKYAIDELKIPWNDQQFDIFNNKKNGHNALSSFLLDKLTVNIPYNAPELNSEILNKSGFKISNNSDLYINEQIKKTELSHKDIENCNYFISKIKTVNERILYKNLLKYVLNRDEKDLNKIISSLKNCEEHYLKILLVDLLDINLTPHKHNIKQIIEVLTLSKTYYGDFHPKTISVAFKLGKTYLNIANNSDNKEFFKKSEELLISCLKNRMTRYGVYHSLTLEVLDELSLLEAKKNNFNWNQTKYSRLSNNIHLRLEQSNYGGQDYNRFSLVQRQALEKLNIDLTVYPLHSDYYNKRNKTIFNRISSFIPSYHGSTANSRSGVPLKYFDIDLVLNYFKNNFSDLKSKLSLLDSTVFISEITHAYNAIYSYRNKAFSQNIYLNNINKLDIKLYNLQLNLKGINLTPIQKQANYNVIKEKLNENETIIEIVRFNDFYFPENVNTDGTIDRGYSIPEKVKYFAFIIEKNQKHPKVIPLTINSNEENLFYKKLHLNSNNKKILQKHLNSSAFISGVIKPIELYLKKKGRVYLCSDGIFHQLPLDIINQNYNSEVIFLSNSKNIIDIKNYESAPKTHNKDIVLIGNPDFNLSGECTPKTSLLKDSEIEIDTISKLLKVNNWQVSNLTNKQANENIIKLIKSPNILHIATHGNYIKHIDTPFDSFKNSYLNFSGSDCSKKDRNNDGLLDGLEVKNMNLKSTDIVVLSACETGIGSTINSEGLIGISRAFKIAGAKTVISTLWKVNSQTTLDFMIAFYKHLTEFQNKFTAFNYAKNKIKEIWGKEFSAAYIMTN